MLKKIILTFFFILNIVEPLFASAKDQIINNLSKVGDVPIVIIHGENDITCRPEASCLLNEKLPDSKLILVPNAGHLAGEPEITDALIHATDNILSLINE